MLADIIVGLVAAFLIFLAFAFFHVGRLIFRSDPNEYDRNRNRSRSLMAIIRGGVPTKYDGVRDDRVASGVAVNIKKNTWVEQGRLSDEALQDVLSP